AIYNWAISPLILVGLLAGCSQSPEKNKEIVVMENGNKKVFGTIGKDTIYSYSLQNGKGMKAVVSNYGGTLLELWTPDKSGKPGDVILGFDSLEGYLQKGNPYFGALVGRYANRIGNARFTIDGKQYTLAPNNNGNTLHGGIRGFDKEIWTVEQVNDSSVALSYTSPDGEEGFPGSMTVKVVYTVTADDGLKIDYTAVSDKKTPVNLTNHAYFNLSAGRDSTILQQELTLHASHYTPVNDSLIPTGQIASVKNTPMDFLKPKKVGKDIGQVKGGYDHNYVIDRKDSGLVLAANVFDEVSGRDMQVWTTQPGVQFYTGNFLNGSLTDRDGKKIVQHAALCLETQHFPDSPNKPSFPNVILEPGQTFHETTEYKFSTRK
ncbi:MAG TPA: aldose epimerase family protein, partial [Puia sp.]|nr:aldose epimerase family protein [Puia sp.]